MGSRVTVKIHLGPLVSLEFTGDSCSQIADALEDYKRFNQRIDDLCGELAARVYPELEPSPPPPPPPPPPSPPPDVPGWAWAVPFALLATVAIIVITSLTPVHLRWATPADIQFGDKLGPEMLNATSDAPGQFTYDPPLYTTPKVGNRQLLRATFRTNPLPSPLRELAILLGLLALVSAAVLAVLTWRLGRRRAAALVLLAGPALPEESAKG
jgi:hypothetical protein